LALDACSRPDTSIDNLAILCERVRGEIRMGQGERNGQRCQARRRFQRSAERICRSGACPGGGCGSQQKRAASFLHWTERAWRHSHCPLHLSGRDHSHYRRRLLAERQKNL